MYDGERLRFLQHLKHIRKTLLFLHDCSYCVLPVDKVKQDPRATRGLFVKGPMSQKLL